ncbi:hypothetical protein [Brachybacterium huguangmaarense]
MIWRLPGTKRRAEATASDDATTADAPPSAREAAPRDGDAAAAPAPALEGGASPEAAPADGAEQDDAEQHAPEPAPVEPPREPTRAERVAEALEAWSEGIGPHRPAPSFFTQMRAGEHVLDLTHSHPSGLAQLLAGRGATRLSSLVREVGALASARATARAIRETSRRQADEVGLSTCHLGIGEVSWDAPDGERIHAPALVRPITLRLRGNAREDVDLEIDATVDLNPVLLRALRDAGVAVDARALLATTDGPYGFDPNPVLDAFRALGTPLPGFTVTHALVVGNHMNTASALADDLATDREEWTASTLVAALAGDEQARTELAAAGRPTPTPIDPRDLVAAVEPEHETALARVLDGGHLALTAPPGADSIDLVVDLLAELNARGRSVLVVSQRRRSLGRIARSVQERGLGELLFDLSPDPALQRNASEALLSSLRGAGSFRPAEPLEERPELRRSRATLAGHVAAMHRVQHPWGASAHDALAALAALTRLRPAPRTTVRLRVEVALRMVGAERERFADALREAADSGALTTTAEDTAWYGATITTDTQAEHAIALVRELRDEVLPRLRELAGEVGTDIGLAEVASMTALHARLGLLTRVHGILGAMRPGVFEAPLGDMIAATASKQWRAEHRVELPRGARRRLVRGAVELSRTAKEDQALQSELLRARAVLQDWRAVAGESAGSPRVPIDLTSAQADVRRADTLCDELGVLLGSGTGGDDLAGASFDTLQERLDALVRDEASLADVPRRTTILRRLEFDGLGELVEDLRERRVPADQVGAELDLAWWRTVLELIAGAEPTISQYDGTSLSMVAERFRRLDAERIAGSADRVRAASDEVLVASMKRHPDLSRAAIAELSRSSTTSVRDLAAKYRDILFRARPTWLASPYLVPQIVPRGRHFDVAIIADGGRLPTGAALPAMVRATQTIVVGDPLEYAGTDEASVLDDMRRVAPSAALRRDPHPATGGLRAFAQRRGDGPPVLAVPSPEGVEPDRLVLVDRATGPVLHGRDHVESTEAELRRVTDLVIEHARTRPERSLAVITLSADHAQAVLDRVIQTVGVVPMLRDFFAPDAQEYFTVVSADQASSIVRDDVIVSIGFGKTPHGRVIHQFGALSGAGGRKALVTALTRSRGRTTVVSGLRAEDLDRTRLRSEGAQDLLDLLTYLYTGEDPALEATDDLGPTDEPAPTDDAAEPDATEESEDAEQSDDAEEPEGESEDATDEPEATETPVDGEAPGDEVTETPTETIEAEAEDETTAADPAAPDAVDAVDALVADLADRLWRRGIVVTPDYGLTEDRIELALGHPDLPGRYLVAVDTDGARYVATASQRERDRLRAERLEAAGWATERVWSWALFIDPEGEAERIARSVERALDRVTQAEAPGGRGGAGASPHLLPRPQVPPGQPLGFYSTEDLDEVVEYICSDGRARLEDQLAAEVREFLGFDKRSVLLDVSVASAIRRYQERL